MYLWRAHNHVNKRLAGDVTEDPSMPKRQFPASFLCDSCQDGNGAWDSRVVLRFLLNYYTNVRPHVDISSTTDRQNQNVMFNNLVPSKWFTSAFMYCMAHTFRQTGLDFMNNNNISHFVLTKANFAQWKRLKNATVSFYWQRIKKLHYQ